MVALFGRSGSGKTKTEASAGHKLGLGEEEKRILYVIATAALLLLALLTLALSGRAASAFSRCNGILLQSQKNSCFQALASSTENASLCNDITAQAQRNSCLADIAEAQSNVSLCGEIDHTSTVYSQCVLNVSRSTGNESYCQLLNGAYQSACAFGFAKARGFSNISSCYNISNSSMKNECIYLYYYSSALTSKDTHYCSLLPNTTNYTVLSLMLSENITNSTGLGIQQFAYSVLNASPQDYCYYSIATLTGNRTACSLTTGLLSEVCNATFVHANYTINMTNATSVCASAPSYLKSLCISGFLTSEAIGTRNISKCLQISSMLYQYTCITSYATKYTNASYCSYIGNSSIQQDCYIDVASGKTNQTA